MERGTGNIGGQHRAVTQKMILIDRIARDKKAIFGNDWEKRSMKTKFGQLLWSCVSRAKVAGTAKTGKEDCYDMGIVANEINFAMVGVMMETTDLELKEINKDVEASKEILQRLKNEITATHDLVEPELLKMIKRIREVRQTVSMELKQSLSIMKDVRTFFLEKEYQVEIERLDKFVVIGERMRALISDGTMDAVCDIILKLTVKEGE